MAAPAPSDDSDSDTSRAFCASYPVPATAKAITRALCRRGLIRSSPGHPACILQWVPISKVVWEPVLEGAVGGGRVGVGIAGVVLDDNMDVDVVVCCGGWVAIGECVFPFSHFAPQVSSCARLTLPTMAS